MEDFFPIARLFSEEEAKMFAMHEGIPGHHFQIPIGYDQFQSLREKAESELKDRFDIKTFHSVLLRNGKMPFPILEQQVNQYIKSAK